MRMSPAQIRAARALLDWNQQALADKVGMTKHTISKIERGDITGGAKTLDNIFKVFIQAGIEFTEGEGVKRSSGSIFSYKGYNDFQTFYADIDNTATQHPEKDVLVTSVAEKDFLKWMSKSTQKNHLAAIKNANIQYKILIGENDTKTPGKQFNAEYKWIPKDQFYSVPYYVYGDKVALISFEKDDVDVFVIQHKSIVDLCRRQFQEMWDRAKDIPEGTKLDSSFATK